MHAHKTWDMHGNRKDLRACRSWMVPNGADELWLVSMLEAEEESMEPARRALSKSQVYPKTCKACDREEVCPQVRGSRFGPAE